MASVGREVSGLSVMYHKRRYSMYALLKRSCALCPQCAFAVAIIMVFANSAEPKKSSRLLTAEEVTTFWVGISYDETSLIRMNLRRDGTAAFARSFLDQAPERVEFGTWALEGADLSLAGPSGSSDPFLRVAGRLSGEQLTLTIRGKGWSQSFRMRQEEPLTSRWRRITEIDLSSAPPKP